MLHVNSYYPFVLFWSVQLVHSVIMFMGDQSKYLVANTPEYEERVKNTIISYHQRMRDIVISHNDNFQKTSNLMLKSVSFAGGGFRTMSYAPSVFYLYESRRIDSSTTYHGEWVQFSLFAFSFLS